MGQEYQLDKSNCLVPVISTLLGDLFCTRISEDVVSSKVHQPTDKIAAENLEPQEATDFTNDDENQIDTSDEIFVCPIDVPDKTAPYIPMHEITNSIARTVAVHEKRCCAWCPRESGRFKSRCSFEILYLLRWNSGYAT